METVDCYIHLQKAIYGYTQLARYVVMQVKSEINIFYINLLCNIKEILGSLKGYADKDLL